LQLTYPTVDEISPSARYAVYISDAPGQHRHLRELPANFQHSVACKAGELESFCPWTNPFTANRSSCCLYCCSLKTRGPAHATSILIKYLCRRRREANTVYLTIFSVVTLDSAKPWGNDKHWDFCFSRRTTSLFQRSGCLDHNIF